MIEIVIAAVVIATGLTVFCGLVLCAAASIGDDIYGRALEDQRARDREVDRAAREAVLGALETRRVNELTLGVVPSAGEDGATPHWGSSAEDTTVSNENGAAAGDSARRHDPRGGPHG